LQWKKNDLTAKAWLHDIGCPISIVLLSTSDEAKNLREVVKQEYLEYLCINNSNQKLHSQLKKDIANNYSKGNMEAYPSDIHKALTLMNK
jgi:hypothetical protein